MVFFSLFQFDEKILESLKSEVQQTVEAVNNPSMKEVKGLEDRLYGLDQFMCGAKKLVKEQLDMATVRFSFSLYFNFC